MSLFLGCSRPANGVRVFIRTGEKSQAEAPDFKSFVAQWEGILRQRGGEVAAGSKLPDKLAKYDAVILYTGEQDKLSAEEKAALEGFTKKGGGLVLLHQAIRSADPEWWTQLAGGSWDSGESKSRVAPLALYFSSGQEIGKGASSFEMADEVFYNLRLDSDSKVVATAFHNANDVSPQIWAYEKNGHRAVVCLQGRESKNFDFPPMRALLLRSIAWAARKPVDSLSTPDELAALTHRPAGGNAAQESAKRFRIPNDFNLNLVAAEPLLNKPTYLDWDPRGRMWVSVVSRGEKGEFKGSIITLEDVNRDGMVDQKHVFAEGLEPVSSFVFRRDGIIVAQSSKIVWIRDRDGDGVGETQEVLFRGLAPETSEAELNNLRWGLDGWIYGAQGERAASQKIVDGAGKEFAGIGSGLIRFQPDGSAIEMVSAVKGDCRGLDMTWDGEIFFSRLRGAHISHVMMPERYLARARVPKAVSEKAIDEHQKVYPLRTNRPAEYLLSTNGQFATASGLMLYQGGAWPLRYDNSSFVCEPSANVVHEDILSTLVEGSIGYEAARASRDEFMGSTDSWFRPVTARYGPDGAMYVIDQYDP